MLLACFLYPVGPAAIILMPMIVGGLIDSYQFSEQQAGNIAALEGLGLMLASILAAAWIRRVSWVKAMVVAFLAYALLNIISANVDSYMLLLMLRCLTGLAGGSVLAVTVAALGDQREPDRAFGLAQAVQGVMMLGAFLAAPWLVQKWNVSALFYMLAAASLLMMLTLSRFPAAGRIRAATADTQSQSSHAGLIWLGLGASVVFFINVFGFWAFVERIGQTAGLSAQTVALALGISQVMAIVGALAAAWASDRYGRYLPLIIVFIGQSVALYAVLGDFGSAAFFVSAGLFQALFIVGVSYQMGAIAKLDIQGRFLVTMTAAQGLGAALGPALAATLIGEGGDYSRIIPMAALLCLFSTLIFLFIVWRSAKIDASKII